MDTRSVLVALLIFVFAGTFAFANEGGGGEHGGGEKAAEGEHGGAEKAEGGGHGEVKTVIAPWVEVENKIQELHSKIKSKESIVTQLLEEKDHLPNNSPQLQHTVKQVVIEHKELRRLIEDYQKQVSLLKYRFPERNVKQIRTYERFELKTIDEMEAALGIDGKLTRNMKKMRRQYKPEETHEPAREPASQQHVEAPKKEQSIEGAGSIILQK